MNANGASQAIAIIGSGCRFPGYANSPSKFWELVRNPYQLAGPVPLERFNVQGFHHENGQYHGHFKVKEAYFLAGEGVHRRFDASFFGMNPAEAMCLDPQCRLLLETVYEALEAAGLTVESLQGSNTAVYTGQMIADYDQIMSRDTDDSLGTYHASGTSHAILSNRISYFFDWHGPSMTIDTACSSSLVAVHQAVQQLRTGHSRVAIAAGANLLMDPKCFISLSSLNMLSPDGRSRMWDADAKGYARGEGIAAIILKTLNTALEDGDHIECIIRETGFAQDGRTQGITSPSHAAQTQLIRDCYLRANLNLANPAHRPQFFECHGTGTLAGDAAEAEAISSAFFPNTINAATDTSESQQQLIVGSIKSVIGHTEGTAGLAGVLKASLALQNSTLPPNLLFKRLNPRIEPFYKNLKLSLKSSPWPSVLPGGPRRASVNSFGFGGANVHAILESYEPKNSALSPGTSPTVAVFMPFVFSAFTETSLTSSLERLHEYLQNNVDPPDPRDLAFTLCSRRTGFQFTTAIAASSVEDLCRKLARIKNAENDADKPAVTRIPRLRASQSEKPRFLGIFTGQGAQHAGMGVELLRSSKAASQVIERLEIRLLQLPIAERPQWSLMQELEREPSSSRIGEATLSQPLCTAVQILQVDLLRAAGVEFSSVVGHSSGEIAAAYAAGFISAEDAICIAYYRGLHSRLASGPCENPGAMMAIGTSAEDIQELCDDPTFQRRVCIAAVNSPFSVTVSGDRDAIEEIKVILDDEKKFARLLKVDKAYHSHHMLPCSEAYLNSMAALDMRVDNGARSTWFSSVLGGEDMFGRHESLKGTYWDSNMISPVLFEKAVTKAYTALGPFDCVLEVGPHPALRGPALQTLQELSGSEVPYTGLFRRNASAVESVAEGLGYIWSCLGKDAVDLQKYDKYASGDSPCRPIKGLPTYAWDHDEYWNESRYAKAIRLRPGPVHELLGHLTPDSNEQDMRWRHVLKPTEISWLPGHRLQNQIVFPAAGYVVTALEAAMAMCKQKGVSVLLIELSDVEFGRALVFEVDDSNVEVVTSLADIAHLGQGLIEANFRYHAADGKVDSSLNLMATARVHISLGEPINEILPARALKPPNLLKVRPDDFYAASRDLDYQWAGPFVALDKLERKLGSAEGALNILEPSEMLIHPALLDAAFQGLLLAYSFPDDGQLWTTHIPRKIKRLAINPSLCAGETGKGKPLSFVSSHHPETVEMVGNVDVFSSDPNLGNAIIQIEGLESVPLSQASPQDDKEAFATVVWDVAFPDPQLAIATEIPATKEERELAGQLERMAGFLVRKLVREAAADHPSLAEGPYARLRFAADVISSARAGNISLWRPEWENDTYEQVLSECQHFAHTIEMQVLHFIGHSDTIMKVDNTLAEQFYSDAMGLRIGNRHLARTVKQLTHRYPHMDILQIGAGTGAATKAIIHEIGPNYSSYTFSGLPPSASESTKSWTAPHLHKMVFKTLDARHDPVAQGFVEQSYDLVVASLVLYPSTVLEQTLQNARRLLKPGGYLMILELISVKSSVYPLMLGAIPGLWQGSDESWSPSPAMSLSDWDRSLQISGFSGCGKSVTPTMLEQSCITPFTVLCSQAMDAKTSFLQYPLECGSDQIFKSGELIEDLVIIGGATLDIARLTEQITKLVQCRCGNIRVIRTLPDLAHLDISSKTTVLSLTELEDPTFQYLGHEQWEALKEMIMTAGILLWTTQGRRAGKPFANIMAGLMRSVIREIPTISYQMLDFEDVRRLDAHKVSEALLRFQAEVVWQRQDQIYTSVENELVLDAEGRLTIPRLIIHKGMNDRYNSNKRTIMDHFDSCLQGIRVIPTETKSGYEFMQEPETTAENGGRVARMEVVLSLLSAVRVTEFGCMFLSLGKQGASGNHLIALSSKNSSMMNLRDCLSVNVDLTESSKTVFFSLVVHHLLASVLLRSLSRGDVALVLEPDPGFATILAHDAQLIGVHVVFVTAGLTDGKPSRNHNWLKIHPLATDGVLSRLLPTGISVLVDFSTDKLSLSVSSRIRSLLSTHCRTDSTKTLFTDEAWSPPSSQKEELQRRLQDAVAHATYTVARVEEISSLTLPIFKLGTLPEAHIKPLPFSLIDWTGSSDVPVQIRSIDTQMSFSGQKTYWFAGLSGGLGLALCEWMARHGAKYFVISSRNPKIHDLWFETMRELGVVVKVASCDVTIRDQVLKLHTEMCTTMPPVAGVVQGSMVLEDTAIRAMTLDNFLRGTRPKVEGSIHLNDLFQEKNLDFFVFFSSIVSVIGRPGQSNYSAANAFMTSLAEQRRRRGLAASIIHIGPIYGIGYAAQLETPIYSRPAFRSTAMIPTSERDFYQLFAEAVVAGRPGSSCNSIELFNGARRISKHDDDKPVWEAEPLMSHFVRNSDGIPRTTDDSQSRVPLRTRLALASDRGQISDIVRDTFLPKVYSLFQLDPSKVTKDTLLRMRLDEMGIDSLLAVEIRGWFMKTLEANIPVLKILSGVPIGDIIIMATDNIPERLIPNLKSNQDAKPEADASNDFAPHNALKGPGTDSSISPNGSDPSNASTDALSTNDTSDECSSENRVQSPSFRKTFKLSFSQETFWFVWAFLKDKTSLNHTAWARITGRIQIPVFQSAFRSLVRQHEILRTCIIEQNGKLMQAIMDTGALHLELAQIKEEEEVHRAISLLQERHVYDVARGQTVRCMLLSLSPENHFFIAGLHPLIADGLSFQSLIKNVHQLYTSPDHDQVYETHQFSYYSEKQHADFSTGKFDGELQFWKAEMATVPPPLPVLTLSRANLRPALSLYENERAVLRVSAQLKGSVLAICRRYRVTPFHFYLAAFRVLLLRYSPIGDGEDVAIGIGDGNRTENEMVDVIGPFVNFLALRLRTQLSAKFTSLLQDVRDKAYAALAHSKVPFQVLLNELNVSRSTCHTPIFQSFVNYRQGLLKTTHWGKGDDSREIHAVEIGISKMAYDITLEILDYADGECVQTLVVRKDLYGLAEAQDLAKSYERLIEAFATDANLSLDGPDLFAPAAIQEVIRFSRGPSQRSRWPETVVHRVDQIAHSHPQEIAVRYGKTVSTYAEVMAHANAVTAALKAANVTIGSPVAVLLEPSPAWISSLLGIMRTGAVYLPLDLSLPWARLVAVVNDCLPNTILVDKDSKRYVSKLKRSTMQVIDVSSIERHDGVTPIFASADDAAVIFYTSGSSGGPKGIALKHEGLRNWTEPLSQVFNLGTEVVLQQTSPTFDLSLIQVFTALCFGGSLCLISRQQRGDAEAITKSVADQGVSFAAATPSEYTTWLHYGKQYLHSATAWKTALVVGEPVHPSIVGQFASLDRTDLTLYNCYGPTETSFTCTATLIPLKTSCGPIAAGRPLPNYSVYVVDHQLRPVPVGVQGEIYIGGLGVGLGYLNQPELTSAKFVPNVLDNPREDAQSWKTMHRTGDLGRWLEDGQVLVEGRIDTQVKLRGLRIDLSEVEQAILDAADGEVCEAVVSVHRSSSDEPDFLVAHIVFAQAASHRQQVDVIQSRLSKRLPKYMCPAIFASLDRMPITISGKVDRRLIAELQLPSDGDTLGDSEDKGEIIALTDTEERLKKIWEELLGRRRRITVQTDFFHVGGSSLLLLNLKARIRESFSRDMSLVHMFEASTLSAMAHQIDHGLSYETEADAIDWDKETALPPELLDLELKTAHSSTFVSQGANATSKVVVLTGASGQLGRALLSSLVAEPLIDHVHCIGVRKVQDRTEMAALDKSKITLYEGDLVLPNLGLSVDDATAVFGAADAVIHNGADMSYLKTYASLRAANLQSTKDLIKMIAQQSGGRRVSFHYVSTVSVGNIPATVVANSAGIAPGITDYASKPGTSDVQDLETGGFVLRPVSLAAYPPPSVVSSSEIVRTAHGYVATKWASEVFLQRLTERYPDWPIVIHRPSLIAQRTLEAPSSGQSNEEAGGTRLEFVENLRRYSSILSAVPVVPATADKRLSITGGFDVISLDMVVKEMVESLRESLTQVQKEMLVEGVKYLHHIGGVELKLEDIRNLVASNARGDNVRELDVTEWAREAGEVGMHPTMVALFESLAAAEGHLVFPRLSR